MPSAADLSPAARATRDRLQSFLAARLGSDADGAVVVAQHLPLALRWSESLPADTSLVSRWQQIFRHAIVDYVRGGVPAHTRDRAWHALIAISHAQHHALLPGCFAPLIAELPVDEALLVHHVEILQHPLETAARELGHPIADAVALLARAEARLHARLTRIFDFAPGERRLPAPKEFSRSALAQLRTERRLDRSAPIPAGAAV